jgi:hypothetical protein
MAKIKIRSTDNHHTRPKGISRGSFNKVYWPYIPIVLVVSVLLVLGSTGGALRAAAKHPFGSVLSYSTSMSIGGLLADSNAARAASGIGAFKLNDKLNAAAQANADDMAARNYWSHYTPEGNPPWIWVTNQGYSYLALAQNLAAGFSDEQSTINGWMASPPHRENLLNSAYSDVGFGYANNPNYTSAGGGPMTIVVAFYGQPQVLSAATNHPPAPPAATAPSSSPPAASTPQPSTPQATQPAAATPTAPQAAPTTTAKPKATKPVTTSHLELAAPKISYGSQATGLTLLIGIGLGLFWASRHLRAIKRFVLQGERYAVGHPLTDLGLIMIACLLFIICQTAGIIQ